MVATTTVKWTNNEYRHTAPPSHCPVCSIHPLVAVALGLPSSRSTPTVAVQLLAHYPANIAGGIPALIRAIAAATQERHGRPLFPGPGNAIVLSQNHPIAPGRLLYPIWLGPDGGEYSGSTPKISSPRNQRLQLS